MKKLVFLILSVAVSACSTDDIIPCLEEGVEGELCREYRYFNDSPLGYVRFDHEGDSVSTSDFFNENSKLIQTITERFENGQTTVISEQYPNKDSRVQTWHYNEMDSLWKIVFGANDSLLEITYENGKRLRESYFHAGELDRFFSYRYFQDDGKLYRVYAYDQDSVLLSYRGHEYFSSGQNRVSHFTSEHRLIGRRVFNSQGGVMRSIEFTDSTGTVTERSDFIYDSALNLIERTETILGQTYKSIFVYH